MDLNNVAPDRREVLEKIALYERQRRFDEDMENDRPRRASARSGGLSQQKAEEQDCHGDLELHRGSLLYAADQKDVLIIDGVEGKENLAALKGGADGYPATIFRRSTITSFINP